jgi:hypothetical protein
MNRNLALILTTLAVAAAAFFVFKKPGSRADVKVALRLAVSPEAQAGFVAAHANSARFKYALGKKAGVQPALAQQLAVKAVPGTAFLDAQLSVQTPEEARLCADVFVETLQAQCGAEAQITLVNRSVR